MTNVESDLCPFPDFYRRIVEGDHGDDVRNEHGCRPRGSFTRATPGSLTLMVVLQNPGEPLHPDEMEIESAPDTETLAARLWAFSGRVWDEAAGSRTLSIARREISILLDVPEADCSAHAMFTNVVRCTGRNPGAATIARGVAWLREEIALWSPRLVLAYGDVPCRALRRHGIHYDLHLPHPAARGDWLRPGRRESRLAQVRSEMMALLGRAPLLVTSRAECQPGPSTAPHPTVIPQPDRGKHPEAPMTTISTQAQFDAVAENFTRGQYRAFKRLFSFDGQSQLELTGRTLVDCKVRPTGDRGTIFIQALSDGVSIAEANRRAKSISKWAERDADVFMGLKTGFIRLASR